MSTNNHTPIANGAAANAATVNAPLGQLDAAIDSNAADIATNVAAIAAIAFNPAVLPAQVRLSLSSTLPVTVSDVTGATAIYLHPFRGQTLPLYDGANWVARTLASAVSLSVPATTSTVYDIFAYWNGAAIVLEAVAWSSGTARATALTMQDGIPVKTGETNKRYVGTFRTTAVSGQCEDSDSKIFLWNMYNRIERFLNVVEATASWGYTTASWRQARASSANQVEVVTGLSEDLCRAMVIANGYASGGDYVSVGVGINSTTVNSAQIRGGAPSGEATSSEFNGYLSIGYTYLAWIEIGGTGGGFFGASAKIQSGLSATVKA